MTAPLEILCPGCGRTCRVGVAFAGREGRCPGCWARLAAPAGAGEPTRLLGLAPAPQGDPAPRRVGRPVGRPVADPPRPPAADPAADLRPCPLCGEAIRPTARKCRFCGEFLEEGLREERRGGPSFRPGRPAARLAAYLLDNVLLPLPLGALAVWGFDLADSRRTAAAGTALLLLTLGASLALLGYQWYLVATRGATLGKRWLGLRIVHTDGRPVDLVHGVVLRNWVCNTLWLTFYLGILYRLVDGLLVFTKEHRCLHDHLASTRVIEVGPRRAQDEPARGP